MRVDNVPTLLKPAFHAYGYGVGAMLQGCISLIRATCRLECARAAQGPRIECLWHEHLPTYIAAYLPPSNDKRYAWMNHPIWHMRAVHVLLTWNGVEALALGSTGHGGQAALDRVLTYLRNGYCTTMAVDGPGGPAHVVKRGALDLARSSGCPLVALRFEYSRAARAPGWDHKRFPLPGSAVRIIESEPLHVTDSNYEAQRSALGSLLG